MIYCRTWAFLGLLGLKVSTRNGQQSRLKSVNLKLSITSVDTFTLVDTLTLGWHFNPIIPPWVDTCWPFGWHFGLILCNLKRHFVTLNQPKMSTLTLGWADPNFWKGFISGDWNRFLHFACILASRGPPCPTVYHGSPRKGSNRLNLHKESI